VRTNAITANATANDTTIKYVAKGIALPTLNKYVSGKTYPTSVKVPHFAELLRRRAESSFTNRAELTPYRTEDSTSITANHPIVNKPYFNSQNAQTCPQHDQSHP
jgi:hypothetical protein